MAKLDSYGPDLVGALVPVPESDFGCRGKLFGGELTLKKARLNPSTAARSRLRLDEAWRLEFRDVTIVDDENLGKTILEIEVRGKRGVGYCKSMPGAVRPFERLRSRLRPARAGVNTPTQMLETSAKPSEPWRTPVPTDLIFPKWQRELFKTILRGKSPLRPRRPAAYSVRPAAHLHLPAPYGGCPHLSRSLRTAASASR